MHSLAFCQHTYRLIYTKFLHILPFVKHIWGPNTAVLYAAYSVPLKHKLGCWYDVVLSKHATEYFI